MELLGIGANMQGSSNYPNFYVTRDLKEMLSGCTWPQTSEDNMVNGGHSSRGFLSPLSAGLCIGYGREALKQIMLKQEAIFKDQIYALHHLYQRQREFVAEMQRRELHGCGISIGTSQSDCHKSQVSKLRDQDAHDFPVCNQPFISDKEKTLPSTQGKTMPAGPNSVLNEISANTPHSSESKSKILVKEMFDVELPTDNERLNKKVELSLVKKLSEVPEMSSYHLKIIPETTHISDGRPVLASYDLNASLYGDLSATDSLLGKTKVLIDLNDPVNFEEEPGSRSDDMVDTNGHKEILFHDLYGKTDLKFLFSEQDIHGRENGLSNNGYIESIGICDRSKTYQPVPDKDIANSSPPSATSLKMSADEKLIGNPIFVGESSKTFIKNSMLTEDKFSSVKNLRSSIVSDSVSLLAGSFCNGTKSESMRAESHPAFKASANWLEGQIDLNICINEEFLPRPTCSTEIELEVPVSPRKEIHSSPRGEFDDYQVGPHFLKSAQADGKPVEDPIEIAAEALVSISSSVAQNCPQTTNSKSAQASCGSLCWLAEIISSMGGGPEKVEVVLKSKDADDSDRLLPNCVDDFEIMTLKLAETKVEGCSATANGLEEVNNVSLSSCQLGKGRLRQSQRKNFQTEVLSSLATLSRYEVTEDIQTIGGLMEAACSQSLAGAVKNASRSRTVWARGKRRSYNSTSKNKESVIGSIMDQLSSGGELGIEERSVIVWGNITRRQRGQRYPASNQKIVLGQV